MMKLSFLADPALIQRSRKDIIHCIDKHAQRLLLRAFMVVVISAIFIGLSPIYMAKVMDAIASEAQGINHQIVTYALLYLALRFVGQALADIRWVVINPVLYAIAYAVCTLTATRLSKISRQEGRSGDSTALIAEQISVLSKMELGSISLLYGVLGSIIPTAIELLVVMIAVGLAIGPWLALYMLLGGVIFMVAVSFKRDKELSAADVANQADNLTSASLAEYISNPKFIREFKAESFIRSRLEKTIAISLKEHQRLFSIKTERGLYLTAATCIVYAVVLFWAVMNAHVMTVTAGSFFLLIIYLDRILLPLTNVSDAVNNIQTGLISMKGAYTLLDKLQKQAQQKPFCLQEKNKWENVCLLPERQFFLVDQTLHIGKGAWIRVCGPSGSGKSTYLRRIYHKLLTNIDADVPLSMHYLEANPITVRGSVFENINLGDDSITREKVQAYWAMWHLKYNNRLIDIDADVENLSAGETQFLAVCRSLLRQPELIVFDEATNSIDVHSEPKIWAMIKETLSPLATVFVVSHREIGGVAFDHEEWMGIGDRLRLAHGQENVDRDKLERYHA